MNSIPIIQINIPIIQINNSLMKKQLANLAAYLEMSSWWFVFGSLHF